MKTLVAGTVFALVFMSSSGAQTYKVPGAYSVIFENGSCRIQLDEPSQIPDDSKIKATHIAGFAMAFPNCLHGLDRAVMWKADASGYNLDLIDGAGLVVFSGIAQGKSQYVGQSMNGVDIELTGS